MVEGPDAATPDAALDSGIAQPMDAARAIDRTCDVSSLATSGWCTDAICPVTRGLELSCTGDGGMPTLLHDGGMSFISVGFSTRVNAVFDTAVVRIPPSLEASVEWIASAGIGILGLDSSGNQVVLDGIHANTLNVWRSSTGVWQRDDGLVLSGSMLSAGYAPSGALYALSRSQSGGAAQLYLDRKSTDGTVESQLVHERPVKTSRASTGFVGEARCA